MQTDIGIEDLRPYFRRWGKRRRLSALLLWGPRGLQAGLLAGVVVAAVARFRPLLTNDEVGLVGMIAAGIGLAFGAIWALLQGRNLDEQARFADRAFGLRERMVTALQLARGQINAPGEWQVHQLADSVSAARDVDEKAALPLALNLQDWAVILMAVVLLAAAVIIPNPVEAAVREARAVQAVVEEQIAALEALQEEILADPALTEAQQEELLRPLAEALQTLREGDLTREEALAALSAAEGELRELAGENDTRTLREQLAEAGQALTGSESGRPAAEAMEAQDLAAAAERLGELASQLPGLPVEEREALGRSLSEMGRELQGSDPQLAEQLAAAGTALQQGDLEAAREALEAAQATLEERAQAGAAGEAAQSAAEALAEGRQEVARAGENGEAPPVEGNQPGQPGAAGAGQQPGQGQTGQPGQPGTQSGQPGKAPGQPGGGSQQGQLPGGGTEGGGHVDSVFAPPLRDLSGFEGVDVELPAECRDRPESCGFLLDQTPTDFTDERSIVPYEQVYREYASTAYEALNEDYVPLGMKNFVRDYFSSLDPGR